MSDQHALSRRSFLQRGVIAGAAMVGATACAGPLTRMAFAQNGDIELVCTSDGVRIRNNPGLDATVLGYVNTGDVVNQIGDPVDADGYSWIEVSVQDNRDLTGWAASDFFERPGGTAGWKPGNDVHVNSDDVNLRSGPGLSNSVIATYDFGTNAVIVSGPTNADGYAWFQIQVAVDTTGWMASTFLSPGRSSSGSGWVAGTDVHVNSDDVNLRTVPGLSSSVIGTYDTNTNAGVIGGPQAADGFDWYNIGIGGTSGWMAANFLSEGHVGDNGEPATFPEGAWVWTTTDVNLRSGPGTSNGIIATYGAREAATVIGGPESANGYSWYNVEMADDGNVGWMAGEFLDYAPTEPTGSRRRVVDGPLNLRENPGTNARIITSLAVGTVVVVRDASIVVVNGQNWISVYVERDPSLAGWVASQYTEEII